MNRTLSTPWKPTKAQLVAARDKLFRVGKYSLDELRARTVGELGERFPEHEGIIGKLFDKALKDRVRQRIVDEGVEIVEFVKKNQGEPKFLEEITKFAEEKSGVDGIEYLGEDCTLESAARRIVQRVRERTAAVR